MKMKATYQNLWDAIEAGAREKSIALEAYNRKEKKNLKSVTSASRLRNLTNKRKLKPK